MFADDIQGGISQLISVYTTVEAEQLAKSLGQSSDHRCRIHWVMDQRLGACMITSILT